MRPHRTHGAGQNQNGQSGKDDSQIHAACLNLEGKHWFPELTGTSVPEAALKTRPGYCGESNFCSKLVPRQIGRPSVCRRYGIRCKLRVNPPKCAELRRRIRRFGLVIPLEPAQPAQPLVLASPAQGLGETPHRSKPFMASTLDFPWL